MSLLQAPKNKNLVIQEIESLGLSKQRLMDLGIFKGTQIIVKGFAPLGDPLIIEVNNCIIAIRKSDAKNIIVS